MSHVFNIARIAARCVWLACLGASCLTGRLVLARPIEFSEPTSSNLTEKVSSLGIKAPESPGLDSRTFKPHSYNNPQESGFKMKSMPVSQGIVNVKKSNSLDPFNREKNWLDLSPEKI